MMTRAYGGKYPHRVKSVGYVPSTGVIHLSANNGERLTVDAKLTRTVYTSFHAMVGADIRDLQAYKV